METSKKYPRDSAGYVDLEGGTGPITQMCPAGDFLEVYKIDKTFRIHTPEKLDPERKDPIMSFVVTSIDGIGSKHPIVARVFIQSSEALKNSPLRKEINKDQIVILSHNCKELLISCEKAYLEFLQKYEECIKQFEEGKVRKARNVVPSFPSIDNLDHITAVFLSNAKKIIEGGAKIINEFFQTSFNGPRFDVIIKWAEKNHGDKEEFVKFLESVNENLKYVTDLRNHQEHPQKNKKTHINNFRLLPHQQIGTPSWHLTGSKEVDIRSDMQNIIPFLMQFFEVLLFNCIMINLNTAFPYKVTEIPEDKRDENCPIRYKLEIDQELFFGKK
jgi:hypothetical protein